MGRDSKRGLLYTCLMPILATKLFVPSLGPKVVLRPRLIERLDEGAHTRLTLISAPAGFGKTTLAAEWVAGCGKPAAWLSLDEGDADVARFLQYIAAALQTLDARIGRGLSVVLGAPQPPSTEALLTTLLNDIADAQEISCSFSTTITWPMPEVDRLLAFLVERLPPRMHLVSPRGRTPISPSPGCAHAGSSRRSVRPTCDSRSSEAEEFLGRGMGLELPAKSVAALENRTEGWIAGLQLAALSLRGRADAAGFIASFTGSHRFVLDYLIEEVLRRQTDAVQSFLLRTSLLGRMCGPLCDAVTRDAFRARERDPRAAGARQPVRRAPGRREALVPLSPPVRRRAAAAPSPGPGRLGQTPGTVAAELHLRASVWYEDNGLEIEAFHHAVEANDVERAERLIEGRGMPLHFRGALAPVLSWLRSLPTEVLDSRPSLWTAYASVALATGTSRDEGQAARGRIGAGGRSPDGKTRDIIGRIAAIRATLAVDRLDADAILTQSRRALEYPGSGQPCLPHLHDVEDGMSPTRSRAISSRPAERTPKCWPPARRPGIPCSPLPRPRRPGRRPGSGDRAPPRGRIVSPRPGRGGRHALRRRYLQCAPRHGPHLLRVERPGCGSSSLASKRPAGRDVSKGWAGP